MINMENNTTIKTTIKTTSNTAANTAVNTEVKTKKLDITDGTIQTQHDLKERYSDLSEKNNGSEKEYKKDILPKTEEFSPKYFLNTCEGRNANGEARSEIGISLLLYTGSTDEKDEEQFANELNYREVATRLSKKGEIKFIHAKDNVIVDIIFRTRLEPEFQLFWRQFETYEKYLREISEKEIPEYPVLNFTVVPDTYADECYLSFMNPNFWTLQPASADSDDCSVIRMLFPAENFHIEEIPEDAKIDKLEAESSRLYNTILTEK